MTTTASHYIGIMTGTSMDAIDFILADFETPQPQLKNALSLPIPTDLRTNLKTLCTPGDNELHRMYEADYALGLLFVDGIQALLDKANLLPSQICAIGCHGQTIRHMPEASSPYTVQIGNPNMIAEITGITTIADFRRRDLVRGGQGAPLVPAFHQAIFSDSQPRVIVNIGGMANITILPSDRSQPILGFDTGPGNVLLDHWIFQQLGKAYDLDGQWAKSGNVVSALLAQLLADPYFARPIPKSTGREYFNSQWLQTALVQLAKQPKPEDVQATLLVVTVESIARAIEQYSNEATDVIVCGGGAYNTYLMHCLQAALPTQKVSTSAAFGVEPSLVEAFAFAWLARQTMHRKAGNIPSVTGASRPVILGGIYWGN